MGDDDDDTNGQHEPTTGCLPVDQSCFALSRLSSSYQSSSTPHGCCTITSYLQVLTISFASLLVILVILCVIRCYLVRRAGNRVTVEVAAVRKNRPPPGLGEDAIAALPKFEYHDTGDECDRWECAICLCAVADGEEARQLPRCMHLFHRGCVDMWLMAHTSCPVCRTEVIKLQADDDECTDDAPAAEAWQAPEPLARLENGERDLEAQ
ncbi:hypothetical protein GUJ93_ZPchr0001g30568 [Zizania palustris]|uniref:RING-type E3 ubiquitin transferase n=1 Tax=Zizania palustris TaxID=103762 RepID=A0A8J5RX68_ZIZPA|nr:hypothetical protein GUJ93_ZPchr0001g30568 [Zizania palustris]